MDNQARINQLEEENAKLKEELQAVKEHLKKYTAPASRKVYYEKNKEKEKQRAKETEKRNRRTAKCRECLEKVIVYKQLLKRIFFV